MPIRELSLIRLIHEARMFCYLKRNVSNLLFVYLMINKKNKSEHFKCSNSQIFPGEYIYEDQ